MPQRETLEQFSRNLKRMPKNIQMLSLKDWGKSTDEALGQVLQNAPVASGKLRDTTDRTQAKITSKGIQSSILTKVPYAIYINSIKSSSNLKNKGELSYYAGGKKIIKQIKGKPQYMTKGINEKEDVFINGIKKVISIAWNKA